MDREQAKFILGSFRPDGADAHSADFAEALQWAAKDRELGEWLAQERAFDGDFASLLDSLALPATLREDIIACLAVGRGDYPQADDAFDAAWIGAIASIQPPASLRGAVLAAMSQSQSALPKKVSIFKRAVIPFAIAAGIVMAFWLTRSPEPAAVVGGATVPVDVLQAGVIETYESYLFGLEMKSHDHVALVNHLSEKHLPLPGKLIPSLEKASRIGCSELRVAGKRGSMICFRLAGVGVVHLVIFNRDDVSGDLPRAELPLFAENGRWKSARWENEGKVMMVLTHSEGANLRDFF